MILLARHGETDDNVPPLRFQGRRDTALNERGRGQAHELAAAVAGRGIRSLYTSDLVRARETAAIVGAALRLQPQVDPRFAESDRGHWEGRVMDDVAREEPESFAAWRAPDPRWRFPGGESLAEHTERVVAALVDVTQAGELPALVICHGGSIRVALSHTQQRGLETFHDWEVPNGALIEL